MCSGEVKRLSRARILGRKMRAKEHTRSRKVGDRYSPVGKHHQSVGYHDAKSSCTPKISRFSGSRYAKGKRVGAYVYPKGDLYTSSTCFGRAERIFWCMIFLNK